jgi:hypothetical protein
MNNVLKISTLALAATLAASFATCTFATTTNNQKLTKEQKLKLAKEHPKATKMIAAKKHPKAAKTIAKKKLGNKNIS